MGAASNGTYLTDDWLLEIALSELLLALRGFIAPSPRLLPLFVLRTRIAGKV